MSESAAGAVLLRGTRPYIGPVGAGAGFGALGCGAKTDVRDEPNIDWRVCASCALLVARGRSVGAEPGGSGTLTAGRPAPGVNTLGSPPEPRF